MATVEVVHRGGLVELPISTLTFDTDIQCREGMRSETVAMYREDMLAGGTFPPMVVFYDGNKRWVADGFHRGQAYREAGIEKVPVDERQGTKRDAILFAVGANAAHGLRRTNADKRRAVEMLLRDAEWRLWSDRELARRAGVSNQFIANMRPSLSTVDSQPGTDTPARKGADGRTINTSNIGKRKPVETCPSEESNQLRAKPLRPEPEPEREAPVGLVGIEDDEPEDEEEPYEETEEDIAHESPREDLTETKEANDAIRIAKTAVDAVWNKCPPAFRWRLKVSIENHLTELAEG